MSGASANWWTQQLAEFLSVVSSVDDPAEARRCAVERAAEALEAELGALVVGGHVLASLGFPAGGAPEDELAHIAAEAPEEVELPGFGCCRTAVAPVDGGALILGRACDEGFSREDMHLLRGMARVLELLRKVEDRRNLLEQLSLVQGAISSRAPLSEVLDAIVTGAARLVGEPMAALRLADLDDRSRMSTAATYGYSETLLRSIKGTPASVGITGRALEADQAVLENDYQRGEGTIDELIAAGVTAGLAVPVHEHGSTAGVLVVQTTDPRRRFSQDDLEALTAYAEHASLALAAARTGDSLRQALNDPLTGLANRALFMDRLDHALARAARSGAAVSVLFVDLDRFKLVNDSLGHSAGDQLLVTAGDRIRGCLRRADTAARLGGDEFAVLLEDADGEAEAAHAADRLIEALRAPFTIHEREIFVSASVGIALGTVEDPATVLRNADVAMYRAKSRGKDRYEVFAPEMHAEVVDRLSLEAELRHAAERDELELHFQPVWRLDGSGVVGVEALVRWRHPERGLLPPGAFIPLAEESGLILEIGRWVLAEACRRGADWQAVAPGVQVAINLSGWQLEQPDIVDEVAAAIESSGLPTQTLVLEITETILMHDTEATIAKLRALKELGARLAIDDFGTGYSSLRYLQRFPIDVLKIPKPFVDELDGEVETGVLARAILDLSRHLELRTVAEGIETEAQLERLRELGCHFGQGFLLARPQPYDDLIELLAASSTDGSRTAAAPSPGR